MPGYALGGSKSYRRAVPFNGRHSNLELSVDPPSLQDHLRMLETYTETLTLYQKLVGITMIGMAC